jgi:putative membrane protein
LEKLGEKRDIEISLIKFGSSKPKAVIAVPSIHPGPFKNIGSSLLPSMLKTGLEETLKCVACVPHGLLGHEFDLASQSQNEKVINNVVDLARFDTYEEAEATPFIEVSNGLATVCSQIFGKTAFLSFTLAPKTTEDFPQELGLFVCNEARKYGLNCCIIVNAHNSVDGAVDISDTLTVLKKVAAKCLARASSQRQFPFEVGAATVFPNEFNLEDGMGPGGITALVVKVNEQKTAYIVIDGNNMVSGLREKILSIVRSLGVEKGEVFTTDTHSVSAVVLGERGYHPVGEVINHEKLIKYVKEAVNAAISNLEPVKSACRQITISEVTVIGEELLEKLCLLIDKTVQRARKIVVPIFAFTGLILMLFLLLV